MDCEKSCVDKLERGELLPIKDLISLLNDTYQILANEPNIVNIDGNVTIVTCIRGNFQSLLHVLKTAGHATKTRYLFLGGYIGREQLSLQCLLLVLALKELYPHQVTVLQGREQNFFDYFSMELQAKYTPLEAQQIMVGVSDVCAAMPIAAVLNEKILCLHGGLSPSIDTPDQIAAIDRFSLEDQNPLEDLVHGYAEPDQSGWGLSNSGAGFTYCQRIFEKFMKNNNLEEMIVSRIRDCEGSSHLFDDKLLEFFSAAGYSGLRNKGAFVQIEVDSDGKIHKKIISYGPALQ